MAQCIHKEESHKRSLVRSIVWRIIGILFLASVTYAYTHSWTIATLVTVVHHGAAILGYYIHERFWLKLTWLRNTEWKPFARVALYELVLSNLGLGILTYLVTRETQTMTAITLTYTCNKLWMYYAYDWVWNKIEWGTKGVSVVE